MKGLSFLRLWRTAISVTWLQTFSVLVHWDPTPKWYHKHMKKLAFNLEHPKLVVHTRTWDSNAYPPSPPSQKCGPNYCTLIIWHLIFMQCPVHQPMSQISLLYSLHIRMFPRVYYSRRDHSKVIWFSWSAFLTYPYPETRMKNPITLKSHALLRDSTYNSMSGKTILLSVYYNSIY